MTTPEDRLRQLLQSDPAPVTGDGLARIQARLVRRKRFRWVVPVATVATAGVAASVLVLSGGTGRDTLTVQPGEGPSTHPAVSASPAPAPCPTPVAGSPTCAPYTTPYGSQAVYLWPPPHTGATTEPWRTDPAQVAERFVTDFLRLSSVTVTPSVTDPSPGSGRDYRLQVAGRDVSLLDVEPLPDSDEWVVTSAVAPGLTLTSPGFGASVTSPLQLTGQLDQGVDESVLLQLLDRSGGQLGQTSAAAGSEAPWTGTVTWTDTGWTAGALVGTTTSAKDGSLTRLFAQPVVRGTADQGATFAGLVDGHLSALSTAGGTRQQLTYPPAGTRDLEADFNGTSALVVRDGGATCRQSLVRLDGRTASTLVRPGTEFLRTPRLSPSGDWSAWVTTPCAGGPSSIAVRHGSAPLQFVGHADGSNVVLEAVRDDGALVVGVGTGARREVLLAPGTTSTDQGLTLPAAAGCDDVQAPAFDGALVVAWETCGGKVHLVRYDGKGVRTSVDPDVPLSDPPSRTSVNDGRVLVQLFGGDTVGEVARYQDGTFTTVVTNSGCTSVSEPPGCVREASW